MEELGAPLFYRSVFCALCLWSAACGPIENYTEVKGQTMGTYYSVVYRREGGCKIEKSSLDDVLKKINLTMSTYLPDSEISILNHQKEPGVFRISQELKDVLQPAFLVWRQTGGAFDVTVGPLVNLWGFGPEEKDSLPTLSDQLRAKKSIGMRNLTLAEDSIEIRRPGMLLDLSAIAKGYAVDRIAVFMRGRGCIDYLIDIGGEAKLSGLNPSGGLWRVGVEKAQIGESGIQEVLLLTDVGIATSGNYRNFRVTSQGRVNHVMDPRLGRPSKSRVASATVLHSSTMMADAYATAMMVLGLEGGMAVAERLGLAVFMIVEEPSGGFVERYNAAMEDYLAASHD